MVSFRLAPLLIVFVNTPTTKDSVARSTILCGLVPCHHALTVEVALMPLGLVSPPQVPQWSKLPFFAAVIAIADLAHNIARDGGRIHKTNGTFKQMSPPHFCLKVV